MLFLLSPLLNGFRPVLSHRCLTILLREKESGIAERTIVYILYRKLNPVTKTQETNQPKQPQHPHSPQAPRKLNQKPQKNSQNQNQTKSPPKGKEATGDSSKLFLNFYLHFLLNKVHKKYHKHLLHHHSFIITLFQYNIVSLLLVS